ncbi:MAG: hypothetical protein ACXU9X_00455 [Thermodesulfobacteriota bacterium]
MLRFIDIRSVRMRGRRLFASAILFVLITLWGLTPCYGVETYIAWPAIDSDSQLIIQSVSKHLGVDPVYVTTFRQLEDSWGKKRSPSLMLSTDTFLSALRSTEKQELNDALANAKIDLMVVLDNSGPKGSVDFLEGLTKYKSRTTGGVLKFSAQHPEILKELVGMEIPVTVEGESTFFNVAPQTNSGIEPLIWLQDPDGARHIIMAIMRVGRGRVYLTTFPKCKIANGNETFRDLPQVLPILMFLKQEGGEFCWQRKTILANLTIDDPWLVEPYGNLSYRGLLEQMERANFHTTIALIPWNYDRSKKEVVDLFVKHPERYSITFHGNNHDRREFGDYRHHSFNTQETGIRQAIVRMAEFTRLTAIPASKVMIFPHNIAPQETLLALKQSNFLATINSRILPLGNRGPIDTDAMLEPVTLKYFGIPVIQRFNPRVDRSIINILLFLQKPLLFYTHQDYFHKNMGAFNEVAQYVNERTGNRVRWVNLKEVCESLYMERLRADGGYDIRMMARSISVKNPTTTTVSYHVKESLSGSENIEKLIINGDTFCINVESELSKPKALRSGERTEIELVYKQPPDQTKVSIERTGFRNYLIRLLSEVRDRYLSTSSVGRKVIGLINRILYGSRENQ